MDPTPPQHHSADRPPKATRGDASPDDEALIAFARGYFSEDFPNPGRAGCPAPGALREAALSGELPREEIRAHLFGCSPCLREYREAMALPDNANTSPVVAWLGRLGAAFTQRPVTVAFAGLIVMLVLATSVSLWRQRGSSPASAPTAGVIKTDDGPPVVPPPPTPSNVTADAQPSTGPDPPTRITPQPRPARPAGGRPGGDLLAANTVRIDLDDYALLRDEGGPGGAAGNIIRLTPSRHRLVLRLPETAAEGVYEVSVVDPFGKPLATTKSRSRDGKSLAVTLNLRGLEGKRYRLRVTREGEAPGYYPLLVEKEATRAPRP